MKNHRRFLSLLLALAMTISLIHVPALADDSRKNTAEPSSVQLDLENLDPATLHVPKLGTEGQTGTAQGEEKEPFAATDLVRVSVFLNEPGAIDAGYDTEGIGTSAAAAAYREGLQAKQNELTARITQTVGYAPEVKWNLTLLTDAVSCVVRYGDLDAIRALDGVRSVQLENRYEAPDPVAEAEPNTANTSENMVGAQAAWDAGYTGAGSRIAIIDTGIDTAHQSFAAEPFNYSIGLAGATNELMTQAQVQALASQLNSGRANYVSTKIPYGYNYIDNNTTINHQSDTAGNHGSHVAGIAAANRYIGSAHNDAASTVGAVGMAPDAQLFIMKVFGSGGGAYDSDYMAAIEDAIVLDCDSANLSLGSAAPGFTFDGDYQDILNKLADPAQNEGLVVTISAGNSYAFADFTDSRNIYSGDIYYHTGGSPGSFVNSLGTAAAQNTLTKGTPMEFNGSLDVFYQESTGDEEEGTTYTNPALTTIVGTYSYVYIDATGQTTDYSTVNSAVSLSGKVVIVNRGDLSFSEKGNNAKSYSPKAVIVANNQDGTILMNLADYTGTFPMVSITLKDANLIKAGAEQHTVSGITYYTGSMKVTNTEKEVLIDRSEAVITDFSSWGVPGSLLMKPEITAPGGDIYSVYGTAKTSSGTEGGTDQYVSYSGTSMAAPHMAGLAAIVAEYLREHPVADANTALAGAYNTRAVIQSLLMSTATPMKPEGEYLSILQQGAGLAEVNKAVHAASVLMMNETGNTLTVRTGSIADGKVKAELGDDPAKTGEYRFGFTLYNLSDENLTYTLNTDLFTQKITGEFLGKGTSLLPAGGVTYIWNGETPVVTDGHDVDKDGDTDEDDAQAILDYLTDKYADPDTELDLAAADLDGDDEVTTYDAHLLLNWQPEAGETPSGYTLAAHGTADVEVVISLTDAQREFLAQYENGAYLEGFTYVSTSGATREGESLSHTHSIPILGFYGSWTDPSMFDNMSYVDGLYGAERYPYSGNADTNYLRVNYNGTVSKFAGNPYMVEEEFPADRLALNSENTLVNIAYNLIRTAGTTGFAVTKLDADGKVTDVVTSAVTANEVTGQYYYVNQATWQNTGMKTYGINKTVGSYNLAAGDRFRVGFYAIPEYNGMVVNESYNEGDSALLNQAGFQTLLKSNVLGKGAFVGYDFTVDNEAPTVANASLSGNTLSITANDNLNLAYVAVLSLDGTVKYAEAAPGTNTYTVSFDASDAIANANGYVAAFAGDYAGNEAAVAIKVNDNTHVEKEVYVRTSTVTAGDEYLIVNTMTPGTGYSLYYTLNASQTTATAGANAVTVKAGNADTGNEPYIESSDAAQTAVWTAGTGSTSGTYTFNNNGWYLRRSNSNALTITKDTSRRDWTWDGTNNRLSINSRYLRYYNNTFSLNTATNSVYLYVKTTISYDVDPYSVSSVTVTPNTLDLYKGSSADLVAKVAPLTAEDRTVTWSSSNNGVATVDENGHVTAVAAGTATITATSNADSTKSGSCAVNVVAINKALNAIIWDEEGQVFFSSFNANSLPTWTKLSGAVTVDSNPLYLHNAYMADTSTLYASTLDISDTSVLYTVNRSTYAVTEFGTNYVPAFGMARASTRYTDYFVYAFAKYLIFGNLTPVEDEEGTFSGLPYGLLDLSETNVGDAYAVAVCARSVGTTSSSFYFLDETGKIWQTTMSIGSSVSFGTPTLVVDTGLSAGLQYQSLYYDGTYIYWSRQVDNESELVIYHVSTGKLYHAGNFGEGVWPAAGLYVNGSAAPASVKEEPLKLDLKPLATREELLTADIMERLGMQTEPKTADQTAGGLHAVKAALDLQQTVSDSETDETGKAVITITEDVPVTNGYITVTYDPELVTLDAENTKSTLAHHSFLLDEEKGIVTFVYANKTELAAGTELAQVAFLVPCEGGEVVIETYERNADVAISEAEDLTLDGAGHVWGEPEYVWAEDNSTVTATAICEKDATHILTETVETTHETTVEPGCDTEGTETYTAVFENEVFETQTKEVPIPATGHEWGEPVYTWSEDNSTVTAEVICAHDETHKITETAETSYEVITEPTTETEGLARYTAQFESEAFETQTKDVVLPVLPIEGYHIIVADYTNGAAVTSLDADALYSGEVTFTVASDKVLKVGLVAADGTITALPCTTADGTHSFTVTVTDADVNLVIVVNGDINLNGSLQNLDATFIRQLMVGNRTLDEATANIQTFAGDIDGSGSLALRDATMISQIMVGLRTLEW